MENDLKNEQIQLHLGNNIETIKKYGDNSIHAVIIDGPYGLNAKDYDMKVLAENYIKGQNYLLGGKGIAGMEWDSDLPSLELAYELLRVLKPGGHLVCFAGSRTYDILAFTLRFAGFRIKDQLIWAYASGVPKGQWLERIAENEVEAMALRGLNSALKPAIEPIVLAQKPIEVGETIASNVLKHGTGALNIGAIQVVRQDQELRYPANIITDGSKIVNAGFHGGTENFNSCPPDFFEKLLNPIFYYSKPSDTDRDFGLDQFESELRRKALFSGNDLDIKNIHPTVKPISLMRHLVRLVSRPGDIILDCYAGSGSTLVSAILEGRKCVGMEIDSNYFSIAQARTLRTQELIKKFGVTDPDHIMLLAQKEILEADMQRVADNILKDPKNRHLQNELLHLEKNFGACLTSLKRFGLNEKVAA